MINAHDVPAWLDVLAWISILLGVVSAIVIGIDILSGERQKMAVMNLVWPITGLYFGPVT
jgi:hypothetical protein